jgi:predicted dehydrogenase
MYRICLLGTGLIGMFYTMALHSQRGRDRVALAYSRSADRARAFAEKWGIPRHTTDMRTAISDSECDVVVVALPNHLHRDAVLAAAAAGKSILCTKPFGRNATEALEMLDAVERAGVFHGYLEDLCYTPKTLKALESVRNGAIGKVLWVRSRETHSGPHSDWFWNKRLSGGGAIIDLGCHCIEIARSFIGKDVRPVEVVCWGDTQVHPIDAEDHAIGLVRYENGAIGQFEVSWSFRGGMDLRDEISGTEGVIWLNHWLRTGMEMFSANGQKGYVAEKSEDSKGWSFPVGDEAAALGYREMFEDMFESLDSNNSPRETFYDGYLVNAIIDAAYASIKSKKWEPVQLALWRSQGSESQTHVPREFNENYLLIKEEQMTDGTKKVILRHKETGEVSQRIF